MRFLLAFDFKTSTKYNNTQNSTARYVSSTGSTRKRKTLSSYTYKTESRFELKFIQQFVLAPQNPKKHCL